ncbi:catabolite repressor/activator [Pectobacterium actinidiae]|uniref:Catabolite repressor/activator n=1 Tax=Pectobacterium actinidiae TaxID=1507808 RepID=A0ABW8G7I6_9GAMM|nr:catabolite repressor/activator [Pectobacterium actinidiae]QDX96402.1 catabolite repressor/activator [Pectobacterium carotovorum subsp. carotovorum]MDY4314879.1 catabolite repressor/activator [Pectobacterium actinidiae]WEF11475.1 catabolite repressor/activator [Pectobacterium actinidiae]GKW17081.1 DNA-binding transcriptional regulator FruR [Pectobacterium carotovorum subsp. carotovorum]GLW38078.1 DNA-binding transcriptional regulator FruR [Pectobacterium carotovorum subsp. carotovorum]
MKLDEIARLAGVSRTTASYVINGKAKQYRVSDKTVEKVMAVVREHNYHPNAVAAGLRAGRTRSIGLVIPDLENTSYTRIANYLERQARQRGYQLLIACSEDQPDNEMRCIEHLLQRQVDAIIVSTALPPEHPFYQRWINGSLPIIALDRALDREHFTSVVGADLEDAEMLAQELRKVPAKSVLYLGALPELSVSFLREQGFRQAWASDPREVKYLYSNSYERVAAAAAFMDYLKNNPMPEALFTTSFPLLQGVMDVNLKINGRLPNNLAIATFGDNELLDYLECPVLSVAQRHREVAERVLELVLASLDEPKRPKPGLNRIRRNLYRRGSLSRA